MRPELARSIRRKRQDPTVHDALGRWAADEFRSLNAQVEMLLRRALDDAGRMPKKAALPEAGPATHCLTRYGTWWSPSRIVASSRVH